MLTENKSGPSELVFHRQSWAGALTAIVLALLMIVSIINTQWPLASAERLVSGTTAVAMLLFQDALYIFALQVVAVLLTAAVIGGVFLAKRELSADPGDRDPATLDRLVAPVEAVALDRAASAGRVASEGHMSPASRAAGADAGGGTA
jgi:hypothetical protein